MRISANYKLVVLAQGKSTWNQTYFSSTIEPIPDYMLLLIPWTPLSIHVESQWKYMLSGKYFRSS